MKNPAILGAFLLAILELSSKRNGDLKIVEVIGSLYVPKKPKRKSYILIENVKKLTDNKLKKLTIELKSKL